MHISKIDFFINNILLYSLKVTYCQLWAWSKLFVRVEGNLLSPMDLIQTFVIFIEIPIDIATYKVVHEKTHFLGRYASTLGIISLYALLIVIAKHKWIGNCFILNLNEYPLRFGGLNGIRGRKFCFLAWSFIAISACIKFLLKDRHINLVSLHNSLDESKFLNNHVGRKKQESFLYSRKKCYKNFLTFKSLNLYY